MQEYLSLFQNSNTEFLVAHNTRNSMIPIPHLHPQFEIYYNISGGDSYFINDRFISVKPYDLVIIPKLQIHKSIRSLKSDYNAYVVNFTDNIINTVLNLPMLGNIDMEPLPFIDLSQVGITLPYKIHLSIHEHESLVSLLEKCRTSEQACDNLSTLIHFIEILKFINEHFKGTTITTSNNFEPTRHSDKVLQYIEQHLTEDISSTSVADSLFINRTHLLETFKSETGITLHSYLTLRRLAEAQKMLYEGFTIKDTVQKCGFKNTSHFTKTFRQKLGYTPGFFQKNKFLSYKHIGNI